MGMVGDSVKAVRSPSLVCVRVMNGLGDTIYHRPFIKKLSEKKSICVHTKYPELFKDLNVQVNCGKKPSISPTYNTKTLCFTNIIGAIEQYFETQEDLTLDLPMNFTTEPKLKGKYAVIRVPMLRNDFYAPSRNPQMEYIVEATEILKKKGFVTVGVANEREREEWFHGHPPTFDFSFVCGELTIPRLMGLVQYAEVIVGGPGWQIPAAMAYGRTAILIYGGMGACNRIEKLTDKRIAHDIRTIYPDRFCHCKKLEHDCDKEITDFGSKFESCLN